MNQIVQKKRSYISFHTRDWNLFTTSARYNSTLQTGTSGSTYTTRSTTLDSGQRCAWPKISPIERTNTLTLHALYSIRKHTVHIFHLLSTGNFSYSYESYNNYPHIIDSGFPWPITCWTCCTVVTGILLYIFSSHEFSRCQNLLILWFVNRNSHTFVTYSFTLHPSKIHIYFYVLHKYFNTHKDRGVLEYPSQDSLRKIPSRKSQKGFLEKFPSQSLPLFMYTGSIKLQIRNHHCAPNSL